jgi:alkaline phosphatase D
MAIIDRRTMLQLSAAAGCSYFVLRAGNAFAASQAALGFTHAVASGEPSQNSVLLWTRFVPPDGGAVHLAVELSESNDFVRRAGSGAAITGPWRDHTLKITINGLKPGQRYFYRFIGPDGTVSPVGRTTTLPEGSVERFGIAVFSCSDFVTGYFNAFRHAAGRDDIDLAVHLGDYIYEMSKAFYTTLFGSLVLPERWSALAPENECRTLADYRARYATYRSDPDVQSIHARMPMIAQWDDHELGNDSWEGGSVLTQRERAGWAERKAAAAQAYREWLPVSEAPWATYQIGKLATLFRTESRLLGRTEQVSTSALAKDAAALSAFRDKVWLDPALTMLGSEQEAWLAEEIRRSTKQGTQWQILCSGTPMGRTLMPREAAGWSWSGQPAHVRRWLEDAAAGASVGLPMSYDSWGGYPAARARLLHAALEAKANLLVLSGDTHHAWEFELRQDGQPAGVEFAGPSVSSPGLEFFLRTDPAKARAFVAANEELLWCDMTRRGYMSLMLTPDRASNDWILTDSARTRNLDFLSRRRASVVPGANRFAA